MEEKERYELIGYCSYRDTETGVISDNSVGLLNQQDKEIIKLREENQQLKQQLHELPKKIVGDIEKNFTEYLPLKYKTGAGFYSRLNAILKKYGGEYE